MNDLQTVLQTKQNILGKDCKNLGKRKGFLHFHKVMLSYDAQAGWNVKELNIFQLIFRKIFGAYKSTHLKNIIQNYKNQTHRNSTLEHRLQSIWAKALPLSSKHPDNQPVILGNSRPSAAQLFGCPEDHTNKSWRLEMGKFINQHYRSGNIILIEGLPVGKVGKAGSYSITHGVNPDYPVQGWESAKSLDEFEKKLPKRAEWRKKSDELIAWTKEDIKYPSSQDQFDLVIERYRALANFFYSNNSKVNSSIELIRSNFTKLNNAQNRDVAFHYLIITLLKNLENNADQAQFAFLTPAENQIVIDSIKERNISLCQEIEKHLAAGKRVFVIGGAAHFLQHRFNHPGDTTQLKNILTKYPHLLFVEPTHFDQAGLAKLNPEFDEQIFD